MRRIVMRAVAESLAFALGRSCVIARHSGMSGRVCEKGGVEWVKGGAPRDVSSLQVTTICYCLYVSYFFTAT